VTVVGRTLAHYAILEKIGAGGMGEVYLAEDTTLKRRVALKILPSDLATPDRRVRFTREARSLAALSHPNIVTVHSVEEADGVPFITMELVDGTTLADRIPREGLPLDAFFDLAIPLADAVAAAHQHGVVHRDLKPRNVMVTSHGRVKVVDFGLAKPVPGLIGTGDTSTAGGTASAGVVVGTCGYMSPEQARGLPVDARSDIFALGVVFYEMLTGRQPFTGATATETLSSVLKDTPAAVSSIRAGLPRELTRLVSHCLAKDPSRRRQSVLDIRNELEDLKREIDSGELLAEARPVLNAAPAWRRPWPLAAAAVGPVAVTSFAGWRWSSRSEALPLRLANPRQITFTAAVESDPTWSPDLGRIAYVSDQSGNADIWVAPSSGGAAVNLTADHPGGDVDPAWSPDGNRIAFISDRDGGGLFVMPAIGGRPVRISSSGDAESVGHPAWSSDGAALAVMRREREANFIEIVSIGTRESQRFRVPGEQGNRFHMSWSPDRRFFAYVRAANVRLEVNRLWVLRVADGEARAITDGLTGAWSPNWSNDSRTLYFVSNRGGSLDLWQQPLRTDGTPDANATPLTTGVGMQQAAFSSGGRRLAYSRGRPVANVWRVPILEDREAGWEDAEQLTFDEAFVESLDLLPDGRRLVIASDRGGSQDLWLTEADGADMRQLTSDHGPESSPRLSPNGQQIAFSVDRQGSRHILTMPTDGGPAVQLTNRSQGGLFPAWSPDGLTIAFYGPSGNAMNLFVVPASGGDTRQITTGPGSRYFPQWSPDGRWIYFAFGSGTAARIFRMAVDGGNPEPVTTAAAYHYRWSGDGTRMYFPGIQRGSNDLWEMTLSDRRERRLTRFIQRTGRLGELALAASKTHVYFTWRQDVGDIWVMDVVSGSDR
jgi:eukaryotic-like serine/threonine-protein kinase